MQQAIKYISFFEVGFLGALASSYALYSTANNKAGMLFFPIWILLTLVFALAMRRNERGIGWKGTCFAAMVLVCCAFAWMGPTPELFMHPANALQSVFAFSDSAAQFVTQILFSVSGIGLVAVCAWDVIVPASAPEFEDADEEKRVRYASMVRIVTIVVLFLIIIVCSCVPSIRAELTKLASYASGDFNGLTEYIRSFGPWAVVVSCLLMVFQSLAAPIPAFLITFANAAVFGWAWGALLSWSSAMIAATICFYIARFLGRDAVMNFMSKGMLASIDRFFERYGRNAILICRLLPFVSFDFVSYAAGLTGMGYWGFFIATGIGQLPATIVYSYLGGMLTSGVVYAMYAILCTSALFIAILLARKVYKDRHAGMIVDE